MSDRDTPSASEAEGIEQLELAAARLDAIAVELEDPALAEAAAVELAREAAQIAADAGAIAADAARAASERGSDPAA